jgi:DNA-binding transcriptional regulator YhcF (GntR family)
MTYIANTVEDYIRIIGSARVAYTVRQKAYEELNKLETVLNKNKGNYTTLQEKQEKLSLDKLSKAKQETSNVSILRF